MRQYTFALLLVILSIVILSAPSCTKTITPDLKTIPAQVFIQGEVTDSAGPYTVTINQTVGFYTDNTFPPISGAIVKISDDLGVTDSLTESTPGTYITHILQGRPGHRYTMTAQALGTSYTASSTMPLPVPLDSVTILNRAILKTNQLTPVVNFQDPAGTRNYYQFLLYINGSLFNRDVLVFDDRLSDGRYISTNLVLDSAYISKGDQIKIRMNCVDNNVYNYFYQLSLSSATGLFNTTADPANPTSNIDNGALGYFSAHTTSSKTTIAHD